MYFKGKTFWLIGLCLEEIFLLFFLCGKVERTSEEQTHTKSFKN